MKMYLDNETGLYTVECGEDIYECLSKEEALEIVGESAVESEEEEVEISVESETVKMFSDGEGLYTVECGEKVFECLSKEEALEIIRNA